MDTDGAAAVDQAAAARWHEHAARARAIELIEYLAALPADPGARSDHLAWASRLANPEEPFDPSELEFLRHVCHDELTRLQARRASAPAARPGCLTVYSASRPPASPPRSTDGDRRRDHVAA